MPQMAPLNWLGLFTWFVLVFLMFNTLNYFTVIYPVKTSLKTNKKSLLNWKW